MGEIEATYDHFYPDSELLFFEQGAKNYHALAKAICFRLWPLMPLKSEWQSVLHHHSLVLSSRHAQKGTMRIYQSFCSLANLKD